MPECYAAPLFDYFLKWLFVSVWQLCSVCSTRNKRRLTKTVPQDDFFSFLKPFYMRFPRLSGFRFYGFLLLARAIYQYSCRVLSLLLTSWPTNVIPMLFQFATHPESVFLATLLSDKRRTWAPALRARPRLNSS